MKIRKLQAYLSSTYTDLIPHRHEVLRILEQSGYNTESMERYPAFEERPAEKCISDVSNSDIYILIVGFRYGYIPEENNSENISITHMEYREAVRRKKPCFIFIHEDHTIQASTVATNSEEGTHLKLKAFIAELQKRHGISTYKEPADLATSTLKALHAHHISKSAKRAQATKRVISILVGIAFILTILPPSEPAYSATDWIATLSRAQESRIRNLSEKDSQKTREEIAHLESIALNPAAWERFETALQYAYTALASPERKISSKTYINKALKEDNINQLISDLKNSSSNSTHESAKTLFALGSFYEVNGDSTNAFSSYERAIQLDPENKTYLAAGMNTALNMGMSEDSVAMIESLIATARRAGKFELEAELIGYKALALWYLSKSTSAKETFEDAINRTKDPITRARILDDSTPIYNETGDYEGAERVLIRAGVTFHCNLAPLNHQTLNTELNLAAVYIRQGKWDLAEKYLHYIEKSINSPEYLKAPYPTLEIQKEVAYGVFFLHKNKYIEAINHLEFARRLFREVKLDQSFFYARATTYLGRALYGSNRHSEAIRALENGSALNVRLFGENHIETAISRTYLAEALASINSIDQAELQLRQAEIFKRSTKSTNPRLESRLNIARMKINAQISGPHFQPSKNDLDLCRQSSTSEGKLNSRLETECLRTIIEISKNSPPSTIKTNIANRLRELESSPPPTFGQAAIWEMTCPTNTP